MSNKRKKKRLRIGALRGKNLLFDLILLLPFLLILFIFLQYKQAIKYIESGDILNVTGRCAAVERVTKIYAKATTGSYFYHIELEDHTKLCSIINGNFDVTLRGYEQLKSDLQEVCTFNYVSVSVFGIKENWIISVSSNGRTIVSVDGLLQKLEKERKLAVIVLWLYSVLILFPVLLLSAGPPLYEKYKKFQRQRKKRRNTNTNTGDGSMHRG